MKKPKPTEEIGILNFRDVPREIIAKAKIGAAINGVSVKRYLMDLIKEDWDAMSRQGILPKGNELLH